MSLQSTIEALTSPDLADDDYGALLDAVEIINANPQNNIPEALRLLKLKLQSSNGNTLLRAITLLDFLAENCGAGAKFQIATDQFINENLVPIINDNRMHLSVKYQVIKEMYKLSKTFEHDESLKSMARAFDELRGRFPDLTNQAMGEINGGNKHQLPPPPPQRNDEDLKRAIQMSLNDSSLSGRLTNASQMAIPQVQITKPIQQPIQQQYIQQPQPQQQQQQQQPQPQLPQQQSQSSLQSHIQNSIPAPLVTQNSGSSQISSHSFMQSLLQESTNAPEKVIALFDLTSDDEDTLSFKKDDIITVVENINNDWLRGCLHGNAGIVPVNYVKPIPKTTENDLKQLIKSLDSSFDIESTLSKLLDLNKKIKTTPMTSQQFESCLLDNQFPTKIQNIEQLKLNFKKVLDLHRVKLMELESIKSNMDTSLETYQSMISDVVPEPQDPSISQFITSYPDIGNLSIQDQQQQQQQQQHNQFSNILQSNQTGSANAYLRR